MARHMERMRNCPVGIFDSGIGGLSVVNQITKILPDESIIFLADKKNFPFGEKSTEEIKKIAVKNTKWLLEKNAKMIVVACNTATVNAISYLRQKFPDTHFVGMEPAVKPAGKISKKGILILSSPKAAKSKQVSELIKKYVGKVKVFNLGSLKLVKAVEENYEYKKIKKILDDLLKKKNIKNIDCVVLGCTHFPLIKSKLKKYFGKNITLIDSQEAVARRVLDVLKENNLLSGKKSKGVLYYRTDKSFKGYKKLEKGFKIPVG